MAISKAFENIERTTREMGLELMKEKPSTWT
jgi:hypothetical protein